MPDSRKPPLASSGTTENRVGSTASGTNASRPQATAPQSSGPNSSGPSSSGPSSSAPGGPVPASPRPPVGPINPAVRSRQTPAMLMSAAFHLILLVMIAWVATKVVHGTGEAPDRQIGIAMVHRLPDRDVYSEVTSETDNQTNTESEASSSASAAAAPPADLSPPIDLEGILAAMKSTPAPTSGSGIAGDTQLDGDAFGNGTGTIGEVPVGKKATTRLFGVSGTGSRFVYVFDRSDSMNGFGGLPLRSAKRELVRSIQSMTESQQFQIIFYNENVRPFQMAGTSLQMINGEPSKIKRAERYIESIRAFGGTKHKDALLMALRMSPDVIFFLTDAHIPRLSSSELRMVQSRAERSGTTIHAIEFGSTPVGSPDSFLRDLASMNEGQYQYVDVRKLGGTQ